MAELISKLEISGFRALSQLVIPSLGRVNLITGRNNAGKSSLLEAIRLLASGGSIRILSEILTYRDELVSTDSARTWQPTDIAPLCSLLTNFPTLSDAGSKFSISAKGAFPSSASSLTGCIKWYTKRYDVDGRLQSYDEANGDLFGELDAIPAFEFSVSGRRRIVPFERLNRPSLSRSETEPPPVPSIFLDPFSSRSTSEMGGLWDAIALTDVEPEIVKALQIVSADIQAVSLIGARTRTVIAKSKAHTSPIALRSFGDGVNRLFGIILSICNARNGILLVDEIENGLHYTAQKEIWSTIFRLAATLNVQVFATSHSWDCVQAFQAAAAESPQMGTLIRLSRVNGRIFSTEFSEAELAIATRDQIEVR